MAKKKKRVRVNHVIFHKQGNKEPHDHSGEQYIGVFIKKLQEEANKLKKKGFNRIKICWTDVGIFGVDFELEGEKNKK